MTLCSVIDLTPASNGPIDVSPSTPSHHFRAVHTISTTQTQTSLSLDANPNLLQPRLANHCRDRQSSPERVIVAASQVRAKRWYGADLESLVVRMDVHSPGRNAQQWNPPQMRPERLQDDLRLPHGHAPPAPSSRGAGAGHGGALEAALAGEMGGRERERGRGDVGWAGRASGERGEGRGALERAVVERERESAVGGSRGGGHGSAVTGGSALERAAEERLGGARNGSGGGGVLAAALGT